MITAKELTIYLKAIDNMLEEPLTLVAVGGTALTLLGLKEATKDVDFCAHTKEEQASIEQIHSTLDSPFKLDIWHGGYIFCQQLPEDYATRAKEMNLDCTKLKLKALHPIDIVITKVGRLNQRDIEDIEICIKKHKLRKEALLKRFNEVKDSYVGSEKTLETHFNLVLEAFFK